VSTLLRPRVYIRLLVHKPRSCQCNGALTSIELDNTFRSVYLAPIVGGTQLGTHVLFEGKTGHALPIQDTRTMLDALPLADCVMKRIQHVSQ